MPFFGAYESTATLPADLMVRLEPGREAAYIAHFAATAVAGHSENILKMDKVMEYLRVHKEKGFPVPKIAWKL